MSIFDNKINKSVAEAVMKVMQQEELKGNQHKIDANKNGKVDAHDFKLLRGKKNLKEDDTGYQDRYAVKNGKAVKHNPMRGEKDEPHHVWADSAEHAVRKHAAKTNAPVKEEVELNEAFPTVADAKKRMAAGKTEHGSVTKTATGLVHKRDYKDDDSAEDAQKKSTGYGARQNYKRSTRVNEQLSFTEMLELYNEHGIKVLAPIEKEEMNIDGTTIEVIDGDKINGFVETTVEEVTNDQFTKELKDQEASAAGKKPQPKVAVGKTTGVKAMPEEYELDERTLTKDEAGKKEEYVKGMKKKLSGFKERYGERAKEVMYATATKMAKEEVEEEDTETMDELYNPVTVKKGVRRSVDSSGKVSYSGGVRVKGSGASSAGKVIGHDIDVQKRRESMFKQKHPVLSKIKSAGSAVSKAIDKVASIKIGNKNRAGG